MRSARHILIFTFVILASLQVAIAQPRAQASVAFDAQSPDASIPRPAATILGVTIDATGKVQDAVIATTSGSAKLDQAAIEQVKNNGRFQPFVLGGVPRESMFLVSVNWRPKDAGE